MGIEYRSRTASRPEVNEHCQERCPGMQGCTFLVCSNNPLFIRSIFFFFFQAHLFQVHRQKKTKQKKPKRILCRGAQPVSSSAVPCQARTMQTFHFHICSPTPPPSHPPRPTLAAKSTPRRLSVRRVVASLLVWHAANNNQPAAAGDGGREVGREGGREKKTFEALRICIKR